MTEEEEPGRKRAADDALPHDGEKKAKLAHDNDIDDQNDHQSSASSSDDDEEEDNDIEDLPEWERHDCMIAKIKAVRKEYENALFFPRVISEEMDSGFISIARDIARCDRGDDVNSNDDDDDDSSYDDINTETHFECGVCDIVLKKVLCMGQCDQCQRSLGLCCYYESQWLDNLEHTEIVKGVPTDALLICPSCVDALYCDIVR